MEEFENKENTPWTGEFAPAPPREPGTVYPAGKRELIFGAAAAVSALALSNFILMGGFNLGFAIGLILCLGCGFVYFAACGRKAGWYAGCLYALSVVIAAGFARSNDGFVKFVMLAFLFVGINLALTAHVGKLRHPTGAFSSLWDAFYTAFIHSFHLSGAFSGLKKAFENSGTAAKKGGAVVVGLLIAAPLLLVLVFLLILADAAFEGLMNKLPEIELGEIFLTVFFGSGLSCLLYAKGTSLQHQPQSTPSAKKRRGIHPLTVNTVLIAVCLVYLLYLFSQLAYFVGGFAGILPEAYTVADYARRGFFEMAWLCAINLGIVAVSMGVIAKEGNAPLLTRLLCLFICLITLFFVAAASGKMFLYIGSFGLTRLRVLTQVIMLFVCIVTVLVAVRLFVPRLPYMKWVILTALLIGAVVIWADVNTVVAKYNVEKYLSGELETVDVDHLDSLGEAAVPWLAELREKAPDDTVRRMAKDVLLTWGYGGTEDFRSWNATRHRADAVLPWKENKVDTDPS